MTKKESRPLIQIDDEVREMNDEEYAVYLIDVETIEAIQAAKVAKESARESALSKLAKLGLSEEEIASL